MADLTCSKCGAEMQESDETCPICAETEKAKKKIPGVLIIGLILFVILASVIGYKIITDNQATALKNLGICQANMKNISFKMEAYKFDLCEYPPNLQKLCPNNFRHIPTCPSAKADTYSCSYKLAPSGNSYVIYCSGHHHKDCGLKENFPQYYSGVGLVLRPEDIPNPAATPETVNTPARSGDR
jgi:hypothetical protein